MALSPTVQMDKLLGSFIEKEAGNTFEFQKLADLDEYMSKWAGDEFPHAIWVTTPWKMDCGYRAARVLKTVVYIVSDEDDEGKPVAKKWDIKKHQFF